MSGGSYDYLCWQEFLSREADLQRMADRLYELGYHDASDETFRMLTVLREMDKDSRLRNAWQEVEWLDSGDTGIDTLHERMAKVGWRYAADH